MLPFQLRLRARPNSRKKFTKVNTSAHSPPKRRSGRLNQTAVPPPVNKSRRRQLKEKNPAFYEIIKRDDAKRSQIYRLGLRIDAEYNQEALEKLNRAREFARLRQQRCRQRKKERAEKEKAENKLNTRRVTRDQLEINAQKREYERLRKQKYRNKMSEEKKKEVNLKRRLKYVECKWVVNDSNSVNTAMQTLSDGHSYDAAEESPETSALTDVGEKDREAEGVATYSVAEGGIETASGDCAAEKGIQTAADATYDVAKTGTEAFGSPAVEIANKCTETPSCSTDSVASKDMETPRTLVQERGYNERKGPLETEEQATTNTPAQRKRLSRAKASMPSDAELYADTVLQLITKVSPRKAKAISKRKVNMSKARMAEEKVAKIFASTLKTLKTNSQVRKYFGTTLNILRKYKLQRTAATVLGINRKAFSKKSTPKSGRSRVPLNVVRKIASFYEEHSTQLPDKKAVSKKTGLPTRMLDTPIHNLWSCFKKVYPTINIRRSLFFRYRPSHVKSVTQAKYRGCLCEYCENINLKIKVINQYLQEQGLLTKKLDDHRHLSAVSMCPKTKESRYNEVACIRRECPNCGVELISKHLEGLRVATLVSWQKWEQIKELQCNAGKAYTCTKKSLVNKTGTVGDLISELTIEAVPHAQHLLNAAWQNEQFSKVKKHLPPDWVLSVLDFAENYNAFYQDEISSAYWSHNQVTLHPIVCYYRCIDCAALMTESLIFVSDDTKHDYHAVNQFVKVMYDHLCTVRHLPLVKSIRFSDGCAAQYKSKGPIADIAYSQQDYGFQTQHNYFGSRHGKGPSDGESAVVKSMASMAVKSSSATIATAWDMYKFLHENATKDGGCRTHFRRTIFFFVQGTEVERGRAREIKTIAGTRKLHSLESTDSIHEVERRALSCFCPSCLSCGGHCENQAYVEPWEDVELNRTQRPKTSDSTLHASDHDESDRPVKTLIQNEIHPSNKETDEFEEEVEPTDVMRENTPAVPVTRREEETDTSEQNKKLATEDSDIEVQDISEGDFVRVCVPRLGKNSHEEVFVAKVGAIDDGNMHHLTYMEPKGDLFTWPSGEEQFFLHPLSDILCQLEPPQPVLTWGPEFITNLISEFRFVHFGVMSYATIESLQMCLLTL